MQAAKEQPIKKFEFFSNSPESLQATNCWPKNLRTLGTRLQSMFPEKPHPPPPPSSSPYHLTFSVAQNLDYL